MLRSHSFTFTNLFKNYDQNIKVKKLKWWARVRTTILFLFLFSCLRRYWCLYMFVVARLATPKLIWKVGAYWILPIMLLKKSLHYLWLRMMSLRPKRQHFWNRFWFVVVSIKRWTIIRYCYHRIFMKPMIFNCSIHLYSICGLFVCRTKLVNWQKLFSVHYVSYFYFFRV